jgi:hypothetical protein
MDWRTLDSCDNEKDFKEFYKPVKLVELYVLGPHVEEEDRLEF